MLFICEVNRRVALIIPAILFNHFQFVAWRYIYRMPWPPPPSLPPQPEDVLDLAGALADLARAARETRTTLWSALQVCLILCFEPMSLHISKSEINLIFALTGDTTRWTGSRSCDWSSQAGGGVVLRWRGNQGFVARRNQGFVPRRNQGFVAGRNQGDWRAWHQR